MRAFDLPGDGRLVHLHNVSGGVLAGDRLSLHVDVAPGASAQITTTGATRLYRHRPGAADSEQHTRLAIAPGALLEYLPDPVIPYAASRHLQHTEIHIERDAALFWWEVLAPGRLAAGERFAFDRLQVQTEIYAAALPILREDFLLDPARQALSSAARMSDYSHLASFCAVREGRPPAFWRTLEDQLNEIARRRTRHGEALWGASTLASHGVIVRGLSTSGRLLHESLVEFWGAARLAVTGTAAIPPRKIY